MEEKIYELLDNLNPSETDRLLEKNIKIEISTRTLGRIKKSAFGKSGLKRKSGILRKGIAVAAAASVLFVITTFAIGTENVVNAFGRLFSFIPGYAIVENNKEIEFVADGSELKAENQQAVLIIQSITASRDKINISFRLEKKEYNQSRASAEKQAELRELQNGGLLVKPGVILYAKKNKYGSDGYVMSSGGKTENMDVSFKVAGEEINTGTFYTLRYNEYDLSVNFKLKPYDSFDSLEEIGPTDKKNNISITAVSEIKDNKLEVELYTVNKSGYRITSFNKIYNGYNGKDLNLSTDKGIYEYQTPANYSNPNNRFAFNVSPEDKNMVLNIPYLVVESKESRNITLKIPEEGGKLTLNKKVKFNDNTVIITEVERIKSSETREYGALRINFTSESNLENMVMRSMKFTRTSLMGIPQSGGYESSLDDNDIIKSVDFDLNKDEKSVLRLKIENPEYFLLGEYKLEIGR